MIQVTIFETDVHNTLTRAVYTLHVLLTVSMPGAAALLHYGLLGYNIHFTSGIWVETPLQYAMRVVPDTQHREHRVSWLIFCSDATPANGIIATTDWLLLPCVSSSQLY